MNGRAGCLHVSGARLRISASLFAGSMSLVRDIYERKGRVFACQRRQTKNTCEQICRKHEPGVLELVSPRNGAPCQVSRSMNPTF